MGVFCAGAFGTVGLIGLLDFMFTPCNPFRVQGLPYVSP
jgi:hypothetical protein